MILFLLLVVEMWILLGAVLIMIVIDNFDGDSDDDFHDSFGDHFDDDFNDLTQS